VGVGLLQVGAQGSPFFAGRTSRRRRWQSGAVALAGEGACRRRQKIPTIKLSNSDTHLAQR